MGLEPCDHDWHRTGKHAVPGGAIVQCCKCFRETTDPTDEINFRGTCGKLPPFGERRSPGGIILL